MTVPQSKRRKTASPEPQIVRKKCGSFGASDPVASEAHLIDRVLFAIPKKGRLYTRICSLLKGTGIRYTRANRLDVAQCTSLPITLVFLPAKDIAQYVANGDAHVGITGQDIVAESGVEIDELLSLGMGSCRLCVQAPVDEQITDAKVLSGQRIVTSFPELTKRYFDEFDKETGRTTQIRTVSGSVEVACSLGLADAVVDLVETGTTMRAAGLGVVSTVMSTETILIAKKNLDEKNGKLVELIRKRIEGFLTAQEKVMCIYNVPAEALDACLALTPGVDGATITQLKDRAGWSAVQSLVSNKDVSTLLERLEEAGGRSILVFKLENCRFTTPE